ncbi:hypothetical protein [Paraburkholderia elongata]|uniref:Uncharacterized protein n=1 Tax=Paraburkholderia elongata TaxID=2675747 RepID=A0A972NY57_9BURK|nr:hypothetical protein [Paraburkholderia elongata]NPT59720.1 hypothetical protein [Paraburkholderia elongata]
MTNTQDGVQSILDRALATLQNGTDIAISSETVISLCREIQALRSSGARSTVRTDDIPLGAIAAFHEVNPLAMNEPYDWPDSTLLRVRNALAAAVNVMLAGTQDEPPLKEGPLLLAMAARNARKNAE